MTKEEELHYLRNDPEILASIRRGVHEAHLGHSFRANLVFASLKGTGGSFYSRWYYRFIINLKKSWWVLRGPWQRRVSHRNCPSCRSYNATK